MTVSLRLATLADRPAVERLAELDSSSPPRGELLLGYVDGELQAALGVDDGHVVADPFRPTADLVALMRLKAARRARRRAVRRRLWRLAPVWRGGS